MTKPSKNKGKPAPAARELKIDGLESILDQTKAVLNDDDHEKLSSAVGTLALLTQEIENKGTTIRRLRVMNQAIKRRRHHLRRIHARRSKGMVAIRRRLTVAPSKCVSATKNSTQKVLARNAARAS